MKRLLFPAIALLLLSGMLLFAMAEEEASKGAIRIIGNDETVMPAINEAYYLSENEYRDPSLHIVIGEVQQAFDTDYLVVTVRIANASQLRRAMVSPGGKQEDHAPRIAQSVNAVLALNGDSFYKFAKSSGKYVVRQGTVVKHNLNGELDVLLIDENGDFTILQKPRQKDVDALSINVTNAYTFGPGLIIDGVKIENIPNGSIGGNKCAQRIAFCQTGTLEYMIMVCAGPDNPGSKGMKINDFVSILYEEAQMRAAEGYPVNAYNLDGGMSANVVFRGIKINTFGMSKRNTISDIIYFASAWTEE